MKKITLTRNKKIVLTVLAVIIFAGYIAAASVILEKTMSNDPPADITFGAFLVKDAGGVTDPNDEKGKNTLFDSTDNALRYHIDDALRGLKLITLYNITVIEGQTAPEGGETVELEVDAGMVESGGCKIIRVKAGNANEVETVPSVIEKRTRTNDKGETEEYTVVVFKAEEADFYGVVSERKTAHLAWVLAIVGIAVMVALFILLFIVFKTKRDKSPDDGEIEGVEPPEGEVPEGEDAERPIEGEATTASAAAE